MDHIEKLASKKSITPDKFLVELNINTDDIKNTKTEALKKIYNFIPSSFIQKSFKRYRNYKINKKINDNNKVKDEKINNILNNINKQLLNNVYILKKDMCLLRTKIKDKYLEWMDYKQKKINYLNDVQDTLDEAVYGHKEAKKQLGGLYTRMKGK